MSKPKSMLVRQSRIEAEAEIYSNARRLHWNGLANQKNNIWRKYYHHSVSKTYQWLIPSQSRVLEVGCGKGDLLHCLQPSFGIGIDFSEVMIQEARAKYPELRFEIADAHQIEIIEGSFDFIIFSDLINDLWDIEQVLHQVWKLCKPQTRIIFNFYSNLWAKPLLLAQKMGIANPLLVQNWLTRQDLNNLLVLNNFETLNTFSDLVLPVPIPGSNFINRIFSKLPFFRNFSMVNFQIARPLLSRVEKLPSVSVIVAARNESGHIEELMNRIPELGAGTEILFVEGNSTDDTFEVIEECINNHPLRNAKLLKQSGKGKGNAVRDGFALASGDILMILDADITVPPEDLTKFYNALVSGKGEFVNGVRLVYPMEDNAMRFFNLIGNKFFSLAFTWLLGQPIRDTLCGTKVLWKSDYLRIVKNRSYFGDFDPFGDFDLLFGAAKLNLKIIEVPIRYRARRYGETNIQRWKHGVLLLRMVLFAAKRIKFF